MELLINPALRASEPSPSALRASVPGPLHQGKNVTQLSAAPGRYETRNAAQDTENHSLGQVRGLVECFGIGRRVNLCEIVQMD
jgi:hypothetical protein